MPMPQVWLENSHVVNTDLRMLRLIDILPLKSVRQGLSFDVGFFVPEKITQLIIHIWVSDIWLSSLYIVGTDIAQM